MFSLKSLIHQPKHPQNCFSNRIALNTAAAALVDLYVPLAVLLELLELVVPRDASLRRYSGQHVGNPGHHSLVCQRDMKTGLGEGGGG